MKFKRLTCIAGAVMERVVKASTHIEGKCRAPRKNLTPDAVRKHNSRERRRWCRWLVNNNFMPGDLHVTLTYAIEPQSLEEALNIEKNFVKRLRRAYRRSGIELKYFGTTECRNHRMHHHLIVNAADYNMIRRVWGQGLINCTPLEPNRDYSQLVDYMLKESEDTIIDQNALGKKRYISSTNLEKPIVVEQEVNAAELYKEIKDVKGYHIDTDSIRRYENPITGIEHLEYRLIADDVDNPRLKVWPKGKRKRARESYIRFEELKQINFFDDYEYKII